MLYCYSVCSDLNTEEGRDRFAHEIVEIMFSRVWNDDKMMRRKLACRDLPEEAQKGARVQKVLDHECRNKDWHPGNRVSYLWSGRLLVAELAQSGRGCGEIAFQGET